MRKVLFVADLLLSLALLAGCAAPTPTPQLPTPTTAPTATPIPEPTQQPTATPTLYDQYSVVAGEWTGSWTNTTFGSTGRVTATIVINQDGTASFTVDIGGLVFGLIDPAPKTFAGTYGAQGIIFQARGDDLFGDVTITISPEGNIAFQGQNIPVPGFDSVTAEGTITATETSGTYTVNFAVGGPAQGIFGLTKE